MRKKYIKEISTTFPHECLNVSDKNSEHELLDSEVHGIFKGSESRLLVQEYFGHRSEEAFAKFNEKALQFFLLIHRFNNSIGKENYQVTLNSYSGHDFFK